MDPEPVMVPHPGTFAAPGMFAPPRTVASAPVPASAWPFSQPGPPPISGPLPAVQEFGPYQPAPPHPPDPGFPGDGQYPADPGYQAGRAFRPPPGYPADPLFPPPLPGYQAPGPDEPAQAHEPPQTHDGPQTYEPLRSHEASRVYEPSRVYDPVPVYEASRTYEATPVYEVSRMYQATPVYERRQVSEPPQPAPTAPPDPSLPAAPPAPPVTPEWPSMEGIPAPRARPAAPPPPALRWRRVFPGQEAELRRVRYWLAELLPTGPAREDVVTIAIELAANALRHTASGDDSFFAVELTWQTQPMVVRVAVADGGARTAPHLAPGTDPLGPGPLGLESPGTGSLTIDQLGSEQLSEHGRGLRVVRALADRTGVCGDRRGRLVWAEVQWIAGGAAQPEFPGGYEESLRDIQAVLLARYPEAGIWFGRATMQWWAMIGRPEKRHPEARRLLTAESPADLAQLLDVARATAQLVHRGSRGRHGVTGRRGSRPGPEYGPP